MMTTRQHPVGSGFGVDTTAAEVLAGIDLSGKTIVVTAGYSGIGIENVRSFSAAGATVGVPARRPDQARAALDGLERAEVDELDLADLESVRAFAERFLASGRPIDILLNNAGIMANPETRVGPGWESQFATNHLGHFALTNRLRAALADGGARVISVSSPVHKASPIQWDDMQIRARLPQVAGVRPVEDGERPLRRRARSPRGSCRHPCVLGLPRRDQDAAAAPPRRRGDGRSVR
jgi:NAD(P)-dependent dehydrogenase (short-subunit alcohol dehydrogenase family)